MCQNETVSYRGTFGGGRGGNRCCVVRRCASGCEGVRCGAMNELFAQLCVFWATLCCVVRRCAAWWCVALCSLSEPRTITQHTDAIPLGHEPSRRIVATLCTVARRCAALCDVVRRCATLCGVVCRCVALCGVVCRCVALCDVRPTRHGDVALCCAAGP